MSDYSSNHSLEDKLLSHQGVQISSDLPLRKWLYAWLLDPNIEGNLQKTVDRWIAILIVFNLFALVFEQIPAVFNVYQTWFHYFDVASVAIFSIEYILRFYLAPEDAEFKKHKYSEIPFSLRNKS
jgi:voltage-gated potassium channel